MKTIARRLLLHKEKTVPILSFPAAQLLGISVRELIGSAEMQARGMAAIVARCPVGAALNMMDLSVEAEAFGARIRVSENENPTVEAGILDDIGDAAAVSAPPVGAGRTGVYLEGVRLAKARIDDVPVFCGAIGPYSLAGRLFDMTELMLACYDSPEAVKALLGTCAAFITSYILAFREAGADGVILAEPAAGLLSPALAEEFSTPYVKKIFDAADRDDFALCYHNCGGSAADMAGSLAGLPADIFHFGNAVDLEKALDAIPADRVVMGNVDPVLFRRGTPEQIRADVRRVFGACGDRPNFMISGGCDIPAASPWENIDAYFSAVGECYGAGNG